MTISECIWLKARQNRHEMGGKQIICQARRLCNCADQRALVLFRFAVFSIFDVDKINQMLHYNSPVLSAHNRCVDNQQRSAKNISIVQKANRVRLCPVTLNTIYHFVLVYSLVSTASSSSHIMIKLLIQNVAGIHR